MNLSGIDVAIIAVYLVATLGLGFYISTRASKNLDAYFLGGNKMPWWVLGVSNASGMFDITGTMWLVAMCFVYGLSSAWLPWIWPIFNQVFLMVYLSVWLRRSNVMTGAQWLQTRFGNGRGMQFSHGMVVIFAVVSAIGFIAYAFKGIGKFAAVFLPWDLSPDVYALIIFTITSLYVVKGGMYSVVITELLQFVIMTIAAVSVGVIAMWQVSPEMIKAATPQGWDSVFFGWNWELNWTGLIDSVNDKVDADGFAPFGLFFMMMLFKGVLSSMAGPVPNYDMQRILAAKSPSEAAKMSGLVSLVMFFPRYMMVAGLAVLALVFMGPEIQQSGKAFDFEQILPYSINEFVPVGLTGLLLAGLLAAFMSTVAATVNAAPAYFVNDLYRKRVPNRSDNHYVKVSYLASGALFAVGVSLGFFIESINGIMQWIFGALFGGYAAANLLKWHWWRFNSYGYFFGMLSGVLASLILPLVQPDLQPLYAFPYLLLAGLVGSVVGSLVTEPDDIAVLSGFYRSVRPFGLWGPVKASVQQETPDFDPEHAPWRNGLNIVVGMLWQISLIVTPIYLVIQDYHAMAMACALAVLTSWYLKVFWFNKLKD